MIVIDDLLQYNNKTQHKNKITWESEWEARGVVPAFPDVGSSRARARAQAHCRAVVPSRWQLIVNGGDWGAIKKWEKSNLHPLISLKSNDDDDQNNNVLSFPTTTGSQLCVSHPPLARRPALVARLRLISKLNEWMNELNWIDNQEPTCWPTLIIIIIINYDLQATSSGESFEWFVEWFNWPTRHSILLFGPDCRLL